MDYESMGTNNKAVTAYLPEDIEARLAEFCLDNGLSRQGKKSGKEKPALGTGIVEVLRIFFSEAFDSSGTVSVLNKDELQAIVSETLPNSLPTHEWVQTEIQQAIASLKSELNTEKKVVTKTVAPPEKAAAKKEDTKVKDEKKKTPSP